MNRYLLLFSVGVVMTCHVTARADVVLDWNATIRNVVQTDGILNTPALANPGWSTRAIAMTNGAMYDAFQAIERTHQPFLVNTMSPGASKTAAAAQAAYDVLLSAYPLQQSILDNALASSLAMVPNGQAENDGVALGHSVAAQYISARNNDGSDVMMPWPEGTLPGEWRSDPLHAPQSAWGPAWGAVQPWVLSNSGQIPVPGPPALSSQAYADAFNQVKEWGAMNSASRAANPDTTEIGLFWGYDRSSMGPPPVLFVRNLEDIAAAAGTSPEQNARLFAMTSVAMADAAIAAWDVKFDADFWRPITAIRADASYDDDNLATTEDPNWLPLGAPGADPSDPNDPLTEDDFTPPFPAYTSGHATMGGAVFKAIELFFGTNDFTTADMNFGSDPVGLEYMLTSQEFAPSGSQGMARHYTRFTQVGPLAPLMEDSPEGENGMSRIYLGIHWIFDQQDGIDLGNGIAEYVAANRFQAVPEPGVIALSLLGVVLANIRVRRR